MGVLAQLAADQLGAAQHVAPLVIAAKLHIAAIMLEHVVEIIRLHNHVVELKEGKALFHALLVALSAQHIIDTEAGAYLTQQLHIVELEKPISVIEHDGLIRAKFDKALHLTLEAFGIVVDVLRGEHLAHIGATRGITDHSGTAANEGNGTVPCHLQALHQRQGHKVTGRQAIGCAVKANIEGRLALIDHFFDFFFIGNLRNKSAGNQLFINLHSLSPFFFFPNKIKILCPLQYGQRTNGLRGTTSGSGCRYRKPLDRSYGKTSAM